MEEYWLPRDATESQRLNNQHKLFTHTLGYLLHPSIPLDKPNISIADVGCGTGYVNHLTQLLQPDDHSIFLASLHESILPDATLHGYDISAAQFPSSSHLPAHVTLFEHNITEPFRETTKANYDIVTGGLFGFGVPVTLWETAVYNVVSLLKAGGTLMWIEPDHTRDAMIVEPRGEPAQGLQKLFDFTMRREKDINWDRETMFARALQGNIAKALGSAGAVREEIVPCDYLYNIDPEIRTIGIQNSLGIFEAAVYDFVEKGGIDQVSGIQDRISAEKLIKIAKDDMVCGRGVYRYFWRVVIGRKRV